MHWWGRRVNPSIDRGNDVSTTTRLAIPPALPPAVPSALTLVVLPALSLQVPPHCSRLGRDTIG